MKTYREKLYFLKKCNVFLTAKGTQKGTVTQSSTVCSKNYLKIHLCTVQPR